jgi:signal transduction histidine kinase/ActR/RegA family two-component response regulator
MIKATSWSRSERTDKNLCALSSGETGFHPQIDEAWLRDVARGPEHLALLQALELGSMVTVPLRARAELLGALTICFGKSKRHHTSDDVKLAEELARRSAMALIQVRLYEATQQAKKRAEDAAHRAETANRVKDEFLATVSHELRTPLTAILGWSTLLRSRGPDASFAKGMDVIHRNAEAQARIVEDILDVSRIITGKLQLHLEVTNLIQIANDALDVVRPSAVAKRIPLEFVPPAELPFLIADPERIRQVIWNLLSNAVKFTDPDGKVVLSLAQHGSSVVLRVADTGRGIDPEFLPYVFERFKQADGSTTRRFGGLGLGLAIVRHIVELHGGQVRVESEGKGKGALFEVTLPVRAVAADEKHKAHAETETQSIEPKRAPLAGLKVVVVDDDADARELLLDVLSGAGATVELADSAAQAAIAVQRFRPHVLVSDIGMPGEDGYSLMKRLSTLSVADGGGIPSVALTAYSRAEDRTKALAAGFTTHISKPVNPDDLIAAIANVAALSRRSGQ